MFLVKWIVCLSFSELRSVWFKPFPLQIWTQLTIILYKLKIMLEILEILFGVRLRVLTCEMLYFPRICSSITEQQCHFMFHISSVKYKKPNFLLVVEYIEM